MALTVTSVDEALDQFTKPIDFFKEGALEGEIDLVAHVRELFVKHGATEETLSAFYDSNQFVKDAANKHASAQQFLLNRFCADEYFKKEMEKVDTRIQRHVLIYNIKSDAWLTIMDQTVIPSMLELGLPTAD